MELQWYLIYIIISSLLKGVKQSFLFRCITKFETLIMAAREITCGKLVYSTENIMD